MALPHESEMSLRPLDQRLAGGAAAHGQLLDDVLDADARAQCERGQARDGRDVRLAAARGVREQLEDVAVGGLVDRDVHLVDA